MVDVPHTPACVCSAMQQTLSRIQVDNEASDFGLSRYMEAILLEATFKLVVMHAWCSVFEILVLNNDYTLIIIHITQPKSTKCRVSLTLFMALPIL